MNIRSIRLISPNLLVHSLYSFSSPMSLATANKLLLSIAFTKFSFFGPFVHVQTVGLLRNDNEFEKTKYVYRKCISFQTAESLVYNKNPSSGTLGTTTKFVVDIFLNFYFLSSICWSFFQHKSFLLTQVRFGRLLLLF